MDVAGPRPLKGRAAIITGGNQGLGLEIARAYVRAFFDTYLTKRPSPLLLGPSRAYPEVHFSALAR